MAIGRPCSGPRGAPLITARSAARRSPRLVGDHGHVGIDSAVAGADARQERLHRLDWGQGTAPDARGHLRRRHETQILGHTAASFAPVTATCDVTPYPTLYS